MLRSASRSQVLAFLSAPLRSQIIAARPAIYVVCKQTLPNKSGHVLPGVIRADERRDWVVNVVLRLVWWDLVSNLGGEITFTHCFPQFVYANTGTIPQIWWLSVTLQSSLTVQLLKNLPEFYGTGSFIVVFAGKRFPLVPILSQMNPIHITPCHLSNIHLNIITHLHLGLPSGFFPSFFLTKSIYAFLFSPLVLHALWSHTLWLDHSNYTWRGFKLRSSSLCSPLQPAVTSFLLFPDILLTTISSNTLNLYYSSIKVLIAFCIDISIYFVSNLVIEDRLCGLVVRVLGYTSGFPALPKKK
jgi:hypothetical protein